LSAFTSQEGGITWASFTEAAAAAVPHLFLGPAWLSLFPWLFKGPNLEASQIQAATPDVCSKIPKGAVLDTAVVAMLYAMLPESVHNPVELSIVYTSAGYLDAPALATLHRHLSFREDKALILLISGIVDDGSRVSLGAYLSDDETLLTYPGYHHDSVFLFEPEVRVERSRNVALRVHRASPVGESGIELGISVSASDVAAVTPKLLLNSDGRTGCCAFSGRESLQFVISAVDVVVLNWNA
jgi:hypothetical protein